MSADEYALATPADLLRACEHWRERTNAAEARCAELERERDEFREIGVREGILQGRRDMEAALSRCEEGRAAWLDLLVAVWEQFCFHPRERPDLSHDGCLSALEDVAEVLLHEKRLEYGDVPGKDWLRVVPALATQGDGTPDRKS